MKQNGNRLTDTENKLVATSDKKEEVQKGPEGRDNATGLRDTNYLYKMNKLQG